MLTDINFNSDHKDIEPCGTCLFVINETVGAHYDRPYASDEELSDGADPYEAALAAYLLENSAYSHMNEN